MKKAIRVRRVIVTILTESLGTGPTITARAAGALIVAKNQRAVIVGIVGAIFWVAALLVVAIQAYVFLQDGIWPPFSFVDAGRLVSTSPWFYQPDQWIGLYKILHWIPVSLILAAAGYFVIISTE